MITATTIRGEISIQQLFHCAALACTVNGENIDILMRPGTVSACEIDGSYYISRIFYSYFGFAQHDNDHAPRPTANTTRIRSKNVNYLETAVHNHTAQGLSWRISVVSRITPTGNAHYEYVP